MPFTTRILQKKNRHYLWYGHQTLKAQSRIQSKKYRSVYKLNPLLLLDGIPFLFLATYYLKQNLNKFNTLCPINFIFASLNIIKNIILKLEGDDMYVQDIKKPYDLIVSLGSSCAPAINLRRHNLRRFSMPLDWMVSYSLSDVNRLLKNKFQGFMELQNLTLLEETHFFLNDGVPVYPGSNGGQPVKSYFIKDTFYNIISVHDFPIIPNQNWKTDYPSYKAKLNLRIERLLNELMNSKATLFIRWSANYDQAVELQSVLSQLLKNDFHILILNPVNGLQSVNETDWKINRVCVVNVPNDMNNNATWDYVLNGITLA